MTADAPYIAAQIAAAAASAGLPPEAVDKAARQIAHYVSGTERNPWPEPDLEDVVWATEAVKAAAPHIAAAERERIRALAAERNATYPFYPEPGFITAHPPFADLIGPTP